jgi:hypothetical protein
VENAYTVKTSESRLRSLSVEISSSVIIICSEGL